MVGEVSKIMSATTPTRNRDAYEKSQRGSEESPLVKWTLIATALGFCAVFLLIPLANVFAQALAKGIPFFLKAFNHPDTRSAMNLTLLVAAISVPLNTIFGLAAAWCIAKFEFRGKPMLITLIDLPFSVSPVVAGLMFLLLFGLQGYFGRSLGAHDVK